MENQCRGLQEHRVLSVVQRRPRRRRRQQCSRQPERRPGRRAQYTQRCQKCLSPVEHGEWIDLYSMGWCHAHCNG